MDELRYVAWVDSCGGTDGWVSREDVEHIQASRVVTIGFVLREDADVIVLANSLDQRYDNVHGVICIPQVAVTDSRVISS